MDKNHQDDIADTVHPQQGNEDMKITNETTLWRRAWIDTAVQSVRAQLTPGSLNLSASPKAAKRASQPALFVAWSRPENGSD